MEEEVKKFERGKVFSDNKGAINSLDFHRTEDLLITAGDDESIHLYSVVNGEQTKQLFCKKYGVSCITFTHHQNAVICASKNSWDESLRYLSLHDNRYIRYFKGHRETVTSICMSPKNDLFMSCSLDNTVRFWDLRSNACQGLLEVQCSRQPAAAFDQQGLVFAVSTSDGTLKLYDVRSYEKGPFSTFNIDAHITGQPHRFTSLKFSYDGTRMLATVEGNHILLLDAYQGGTMHTLALPPGPAGEPQAQHFEASWSPDDEWIISGAPDCTVRVWNSASGEEVAQWGGLEGVPYALKWAPRRKLVASGDSHGTLGLWIPNVANAS